jgi:hypothetical protein|tara:strand:+ start:89 stop:295 length:207 start_codon:yes stop_codon:yes gene_type:complete
MTLTVLNFEDSNVYIIDMTTIAIWDQLWTSEDYEEFLNDNEFKLSNIQWMVGKDTEFLNMKSNMKYNG